MYITIVIHTGECLQKSCELHQTRLIIFAIVLASIFKLKFTVAWLNLIQWISNIHDSSQSSLTLFFRFFFLILLWKLMASVHSYSYHLSSLTLLFLSRLLRLQNSGHSVTLSPWFLSFCLTFEPWHTCTCTLQGQLYMYIDVIAHRCTCNLFIIIAYACTCTYMYMHLHVYDYYKLCF